MKNVTFSGPVLTQSGYGVHARQVAKWLLQRNDVNVKFLITPWGNTPFILDSTMHNGLIGEIMQRSTSPENIQKSDVSIQLKLPNEWETKLSNVNVGITAAVETDRCNPDWISSCNRMNKVIVPSQHAKLNLTNSGPVTCPIDVIPEAYSDVFLEEIESPVNKFSTNFNFLIFGQITGNTPFNDRKNTYNTIKWICDIFKDDPDVGIVIKTNAGRNTKIDKHMVVSLLTQLVNEIRKGPYPKIHLLHGEMSDKEVAQVYKHPQIKALVSLTRGEGYGLPILEAAAAGLPVIATNWSGHLDFLKHGKFIPVYYQLQQVHKSRIDNSIFIEGVRWAEAQEDDAKKKLFKFRNSPEIPTQWAKELSPKILENYSQSAINKLYDESFKQIL